MAQLSSQKSISLGRDTVYGAPVFLTAEERSHHIYVIGKTGMGKSTFLESLALQDIHRNRGVCFIDPHGDSAQRLASCIPRSRINDTIYFDLADRDYPIGFNPLGEALQADRRELAASQLVAMFKDLFGASWGEWLEYLLKHCLLTLLSQKSTAVSLVSVQRMLVEPAFRKQLVEQLRDPVLLQFWEQFFAELRDREALERVSSTLNKVGKFSLSPVLRNIIGQTRSGFDLQRAMEDGQIVIVNLAKGQVGEDNANFIGGLIVSRVAELAEERGAQARSARRPFYLYVDEFQTVTTERFESVVSEARKYALSLTIAHQNCSQIRDARLLRSIIKTVGTRVAFSIDYEDAELLAKSFHPLRPDGITDSGQGTFFVRHGAGNARQVQGYGGEDQAFLCTNSFERVVKNSRWRYSRPRAAVERDFAAWWAG